MAIGLDTLKPPADGAVSRYPDTRVDAVLVVSFGGPEQPDDVMPFLENVTQGRGVPRERLEEVAHHYHELGGRSPINDQNRALVAALSAELEHAGLRLPVFLGNRNWHPLLADTLHEMAQAGIERALGLFTSGFSCYSGCRQYRENVYTAQRSVGPEAPEVAKLRSFWNHPGFIDASAELAQAALERVPAERRETAHVAFTAHSIPVSMARGSRYEVQLAEAARLVAGLVGIGRYAVVYQSRSGSPEVPWLEPDVCDHLRALHAKGVQDVVLVPLGFVSDHVEVLYDLDVEAAQVAASLGLGLVRASTVGTHPRFVAALRELVEERLDPVRPRRALGRFGPGPDVCGASCCLSGTGRPSPWVAERPAVTGPRGL